MKILLIVLAVIFSFIPIKLNSFVQTLLPLYWDQVRPKRDLQFYAAFIFFGIIAQSPFCLSKQSKRLAQIIHSIFVLPFHSFRLPPQ